MVDKKRREAEGPECSLVQYQRGGARTTLQCCARRVSSPRQLTNSHNGSSALQGPAGEG
jgi:hypothetical protein